MAPADKGSYRFDPKGIVDIRNNLGMTQFHMAMMLGVPANTLSRWETGKATPDAHSLAAVYSFAQERGLHPTFFRKYVEGHRIRMVVILDFQSLGVSALDVRQMDQYIMEEVERVAPTTHVEIFRAYASPDQVVGIAELKKLKWQVRVDESDQDDAIAQQVRDACGHNPEETILIICAKDGGFAEMIGEMRGSGVEVYLLAPPNTNQALLDAVDTDHRTQWPAHFPAVVQTPSMLNYFYRTARYGDPSFSNQPQSED